LIALERTSTKGDDRTGIARDGNDQPITEPIDLTPVVSPGDQTAFLHRLRREALFQQPLAQAVARRWRIAESQRGNGFSGQTTRAEEILPDARPRWRVQLFAEIRSRDFVDA
jgi:hypothetical protein